MHNHPRRPLQHAACLACCSLILLFSLSSVGCDEAYSQPQPAENQQAADLAKKVEKAFAERPTYREWSLCTISTPGDDGVPLSIQLYVVGRDREGEKLGVVLPEKYHLLLTADRLMLRCDAAGNAYLDMPRPADLDWPAIQRMVRDLLVMPEPEIYMPMLEPRHMSLRPESITSIRPRRNLYAPLFAPEFAMFMDPSFDNIVKDADINAWQPDGNFAPVPRDFNPLLHAFAWISEDENEDEPFKPVQLEADDTPVSWLKLSADSGEAVIAVDPKTHLIKAVEREVAASLAGGSADDRIKVNTLVLGMAGEDDIPVRIDPLHFEIGSAQAVGSVAAFRRHLIQPLVDMHRADGDHFKWQLKQFVLYNDAVQREARALRDLPANIEPETRAKLQERLEMIDLITAANDEQARILRAFIKEVEQLP